MYLTAEGGLAGARGAWEKLEAKLGDLKGRKFYGLFFEDRGEYRVCVAMREDDDPNALGLKVGIIPGGKYAESKIADWSERIKDIGLTFDAMAAEHEVDQSRPSIEFYRSHRELILLLPIK